MFYIRTIKTKSKATAVQVVKYKNRKRIVVSHIGSAHDKQELNVLRKAATGWIKKNSRQEALFSVEKLDEVNRTDMVSLQKLQYLGVTYSFIYDYLNKLFERFGFNKINYKMILDLALIRIIEPASKLRSFELLEELFGIKYSRPEFYRNLSDFVKTKSAIEEMSINMAEREFNFDFNLVFYDVTTLYFEAFGEDEFRKPGFSKDGKSNQPQILIGLAVNNQGFPVAYEIFEGNKFEGKTIIPVITAFRRRHHVKKLTVVADAGMISFNNITELKKKRLHYIVGARMLGLTAVTIKRVSKQIQGKDGANLKIRTKLGSLVCAFSEARYKKDKREMEKQIARAEALLKTPGKIKRAKFLQSSTNSKKPSLALNKVLIEKTKSLLGIKGYYTNLGKVDNQTVIKQYHDLWHVEHAFRIAKSDLEMRPIYHFKKETIEAHILICFMALAICKYMELKTGKSTQKIIYTAHS